MYSGKSLKKTQNMDSYLPPYYDHDKYLTSPTYNKSAKYKRHSSPSISLLTHSKFRKHSSVEPPKISNGPSTSELRRHRYLELQEQTTSLTRRQSYDNNQFKGSSHPRELLDQFRSTECELCNVQFSAPIMSKMHYSGKQHLKKVRHFMERWSLITGNPIPYLREDKSASTVVTKPEYCELCDVEMLTLNEKILHISGKKHIKNTTDPTKLKKRKIEHHYRPMVKQVDGNTFRRTEMSKRGIGSAFKLHSEDNLVGHLNGKTHKERFKNKELEINEAHTDSCPTRCKPCKMSFQNEKDMEQHKQTIKHKICLLNQEGGDRIIPGFEYWYCMTCKAQFIGSKEYTEHLFGEKHMTLDVNCASMQTDLFYCTVCDLMMGHEEKDSHMNELEHRRKVVKNYSMKLITDMANADDNTLYYSCPDCPDAGSMNFITFNNHLLTNAHTDRVLKRKPPL